MKKLRVYLDTSVLGGAFDVEFAEATLRLLEYVHRGRIIPLISQTLVAEIAKGPERVKQLLDDIPQDRAEIIRLTPDMVELQKAYLRARVVTAKYADDAYHVAQATLARSDVIVSWNFRHIVHPQRIKAFNAVNRALGYDIMVILSPSDLLRTLEA